MTAKPPTDPKPLTALQQIDDLSMLATRSCDRKRASRKDAGIKEVHDMESYYNGQAIAFIAARKLMEAELRRLCNLFQNGSLSVADFGVVL